MKTTNSVTLQIFRFSFSNWQIDVFNWSTFVLLLFLHLFLRDLQSDNKIGALRSKHLVNVFEVKILFGSIISLKTEHHSSLFLNSLEHIVKSIHCLYDIGIPQRLIFAKSFDELNGFLQRQQLDELWEQFEDVEFENRIWSEYNVGENELISDYRRNISDEFEIGWIYDVQS